jgi:hypothetical protein
MEYSVMTVVGKSLFAGVAMLALTCAAPAMAAIVAFDSPTGNLGSATHTYGGAIAYGFAGLKGGDWTARNLFGKNEGATENGLGLASTSDNEINPASGREAVVLDLTAFIGKDVSIALSSVQPGESGRIGFASSFSASDPDRNAFGSFTNITDNTLHDFGVITASDHWVAIEGGEGNVLLSELSTPNSVPEPASLILLGSTLLGFGALRRRRL